MKKYQCLSTTSPPFSLHLSLLGRQSNFSHLAAIIHIHICSAVVGSRLIFVPSFSLRPPRSIVVHRSGGWETMGWRGQVGWLLRSWRFGETVGEPGDVAICASLDDRMCLRWVRDSQERWRAREDFWRPSKVLVLLCKGHNGGACSVAPSFEC